VAGRPFSSALEVAPGLALCQFRSSLVTSHWSPHHLGKSPRLRPLQLVGPLLFEWWSCPVGWSVPCLAWAHPWLGALPLWAAGFVSQFGPRLGRSFFAVLRRWWLVRFPTGFETLFSMRRCGFFCRLLPAEEPAQAGGWSWGGASFGRWRSLLGRDV